MFTLTPRGLGQGKGNISVFSHLPFADGGIFFCGQDLSLIRYPIRLSLAEEKANFPLDNSFGNRLIG
jgi:hypothetical protein